MNTNSYRTIEEAKANGKGSIIWLEILKSFVVVLVIVIASDAIVTMINEYIFHGNETEPFFSLVYLYEQLITVLFTLSYCKFVEHRNLSSMGLRTFEFGNYGKGLLIGFSLFSFVVIFGILTKSISFVTYNSDLNFGLVILFFGGFIIQGFSEELLCRSYVFVSMTRKNSIILAAIFSSALFSMLHIFNDGIGVIPLINLFLFGILEVICFLKTDSIWLAAAVHTMWNYAEGCLYGFSVSGSPINSSVFIFKQEGSTITNGGLFGPEGGVIVTAILVLTIVLDGVYSMKEKR